MQPENMDEPKVSFSDQGFQRPVQYSQNESPKIIRWVTNYSGGFIKDEKQANYVIIAFIVVAIGVSIFLFLFSNTNTKQEATPESIKQAEESQRIINSIQP